MKTKIAVFDLDGTLVKGFIIGSFSRFLEQKGIFGKQGLRKIENLMKHYKKGRLSYEEFAYKILETYGRLLKGNQYKNITELAKEFVDSGGLNTFDFSAKLVKLIKDNEYLPIIITGSPREVAALFSASLGIDTVFATEYEVCEGVFTGKLTVNCALRETKLAVLSEYVKKANADLKKSVGFGDTHHDLAFLELVGFPVAVRPNKILSEIAGKRRWLICEDSRKIISEVKKYLRIQNQAIKP